MDLLLTMPLEDLDTRRRRHLHYLLAATFDISPSRVEMMKVWWTRLNVVPPGKTEALELGNRTRVQFWLPEALNESSLGRARLEQEVSRLLFGAQGWPTQIEVGRASFKRAQKRALAVLVEFHASSEVAELESALKRSERGGDEAFLHLVELYSPALLQILLPWAQTLDEVVETTTRLLMPLFRQIKAVVSGKEQLVDALQRYELELSRLLRHGSANPRISEAEILAARVRSALRSILDNPDLPPRAA